MATHSSTLAWEIPWTDWNFQSGGLQPMGHKESNTTQQLNNNNKMDTSDNIFLKCWCLTGGRRNSALRQFIYYLIYDQSLVNLSFLVPLFQIYFTFTLFQI